MKRNKAFRKLKLHILSFFNFNQKSELRMKSRSFKRWENGWKRHCSSRGMMRRIGSRENAIKLGLIKI